jgi:hypothetical protein
MEHINFRSEAMRKLMISIRDSGKPKSFKHVGKEL